MWGALLIRQLILPFLVWPTVFQDSWHNFLSCVAGLLPYFPATSLRQEKVVMCSTFLLTFFHWSCPWDSLLIHICLPKWLFHLLTMGGLLCHFSLYNLFHGQRSLPWFENGATLQAQASLVSFKPVCWNACRVNVPLTFQADHVSDMNLSSSPASMGVPDFVQWALTFT